MHVLNHKEGTVCLGSAPVSQKSFPPGILKTGKTYTSPNPQGQSIPGRAATYPALVFCIYHPLMIPDSTGTPSPPEPGTHTYASPVLVQRAMNILCANHLAHLKRMPLLRFSCFHHKIHCGLHDDAISGTLCKKHCRRNDRGTPTLGANLKRACWGI